MSAYCHCEPAPAPLVYQLPLSWLPHHAAPAMGSSMPTSLPVQGLNPAQIAMAAARNLGVHSALPAQTAQALSGLGGGAGYQANPQLLAQLMRPQQQQQQQQNQQQAAPAQCGFLVEGLSGGGADICVCVVILVVLVTEGSRGRGWKGWLGEGCFHGRSCMTVDPRIPTMPGRNGGDLRLLELCLVCVVFLRFGFV